MDINARVWSDSITGNRMHAFVHGSDRTGYRRALCSANVEIRDRGPFIAHAYAYLRCIRCHKAFMKLIEITQAEDVIEPGAVFVKDGYRITVTGVFPGYTDPWSRERHDVSVLFRMLDTRTDRETRHSLGLDAFLGSWVNTAV